MDVRRSGVSLEQNRNGIWSAVSHVAETLLLFGSLFLTLPPIPSDQAAELPLLPMAVYATCLFAGSRWLRWRRNYLWLLETAGFVVFVYVANAVANVIYAL